MSAKISPLPNAAQPLPQGAPKTPMPSPALQIKKRVSDPLNGSSVDGESAKAGDTPSGRVAGTNFFSRATVRLPGIPKRNSDPPKPSPGQLSGTQRHPSDTGSRKGSDTSMRRKESTSSIEITQYDSTMNDEQLIQSQDRTVNFSRDLFALGSKKVRRKKSDSDKNSGDAEEADSQSNLASTTLVLLFIVGILVGLVNGLTIMAGRIIGEYQVRIIELEGSRWGLGLLYFSCSTVLLASLAAYLCTLSSQAVYGSGMPEMKALLASDFTNAEYPKIVSWKIMFIRMTSLVLALGSGLSVGSAGPLVHVAACVAYILMKFVPEFGDIFDSPSQTKQIFAASAAVGLTAVFNAPVGGLLFSVEVTSTFYLISNYWKSFMAATASAVAFNLVLLAQGEAAEIRVFELRMNNRPFLKWEFCLYIILGVTVGYIAKFYLRIHQAWWKVARKYTSKHPVGTAALVGLVTAVLIYCAGAYTETNVGVGAAVRDALTTGSIASMRRFTSIPQLIALPMMFLLRMFLTMIATNLRIPAGLFTPMFLLGAQFGRFFGVVLQSIVGPGIDVYITGYALVGAVAFVSGITHTISAAVIAVELTGQLDMLLPCLIGAVVASGITKNQGLSLYDQGMVNKGLESFQLLIMGAGGYNHAIDIVDRHVNKLTRISTIKEIFTALETGQTVFPVINNTDSNRLIGSITRHDAFYFLKKTYADQNLGWYVREKLPQDTKEDDEKIARVKAKANYRWLRSIKTSISHDPSEIAHDGDGDDGTENSSSLRRAVATVRAFFGLSSSSRTRASSTAAASDCNGTSKSDSPQSSAKKKSALELLASSHMMNQQPDRRRQYRPVGDRESTGMLTRTDTDADIENQTLSLDATSPTAGAAAGDDDNNASPEDKQKAKEANAAAMLLNAFVHRRTMNLSSKSGRSTSGDSDCSNGSNTPGGSGSHLVNISGNINRNFSNDDFTSSDSQFTGRRIEESPQSPAQRKNLLPPLKNAPQYSSEQSNVDSNTSSPLSRNSPESAAGTSNVNNSSANSSSSAGSSSILSVSTGIAPRPLGIRTSFTAVGGGDSILASVEEAGHEDDHSENHDATEAELNDSDAAPRSLGKLSVDVQSLESFKERRLSKLQTAIQSPSNVLQPGHRSSAKKRLATASSVSPFSSSATTTDATTSVTTAVPAATDTEMSAVDSSALSPVPSKATIFPVTVTTTTAAAGSVVRGADAEFNISSSPAAAAASAARGIDERKYSSDEDAKTDDQVRDKAFFGQSQHLKFSTAVKHSSQLVVPDKAVGTTSLPPDATAAVATTVSSAITAAAAATTAAADAPLTNAAVTTAAAAFMRKSKPLSAAKLQSIAKLQQSGEDASSSAKTGMIARLAKVAQNVVSSSPKINRPKSSDMEQQIKEKIERLLSSPVDVVKEPMLPINAFPFTAHERTPMEHIYVLFEMVKVTCVFIIGDNKQLTGMISKEHLLSSLKKKNS